MNISYVYHIVILIILLFVFFVSGLADDNINILKLPSIQLQNLVPFGRISIDLEFVTYAKNGVIFFCSDSKRKSNVHVALTIRNKYLELR